MFRRKFLSVGAIVPPLLLVAPEAAARDRILCIVVGADSPILDLSVLALRRAFENQEKISAFGARLIPLNQPPQTETRQAFDRLVLGLLPGEMPDHWISKKKSGAGGPPRTVPGFATLRRVLRRLPGAIGYLPPRQLTNQVKVVKLDGKYPESEDYPLRY